MLPSGGREKDGGEKEEEAEGMELKEAGGGVGNGKSFWRSEIALSKI